MLCCQFSVAPSAALIDHNSALRGYFASLDDEDGLHLNMSRASACEAVAWRFTSYLSEDDTIKYLLSELSPITPDPDEGDTEAVAENNVHEHRMVSYETSDETTPLIAPQEISVQGPSADGRFEELALSLGGLNALEIGAISDAKHFISRSVVQVVINGLFKGNIILWPRLDVHSQKAPQRYHPSLDIYCRLRVPYYLKCYETLFFAVFLLLYYLVLVDRQVQKITAPEVLLWVWLAAFTYDEFGQFTDAGLAFYAADFWSVWDFGIILIGMAYFIARMVGISQHSLHITNISLDILSLEALLLVPRTASILSLHPFFGPLLPVLRTMSLYACKFMGLVMVLYLGFLATFTLLARDNFTPIGMSWILIKVFFGSSYLGFDAADQISPIFGAPLMLVFVFLSNILLLTALISLLSNSLEEIMNRSHQEYLFQRSVYVLEAATSNRLTYFLPPFNLLSLLLRPLRYCLSADKFRSARLMLLRIVHFPHVWVIKSCEALQSQSQHRCDAAKTIGYEHSKSSAKAIQSTKVVSSSLLRRRLRVRGTIPPSHPEPAGATSHSRHNRGTPPPSRHDHVGTTDIARLCKHVEHLADKVDKLTNAQSSTTQAPS